MKLCFLGLFGLYVGLLSSSIAQETSASKDSTFWLLSLPELQSYKSYYIQELEALQEEKQNLIQRGIEDGERLLRMRPDAKMVDEVLIRLADLYYYKEKEDYLNRMKLYDEKLTQYEQGKLSEPPEEPRPDYHKSMEIYQRIIDEFPQSKLVDDAIYNKAFLFEEMGENKKANQVYLYLIDAYPQSKYVPEAYMRLGEYYFNPPVNDLTKAIEFYKKVLQYKDSPRYDEALYKLGWSYYRLSKYPEAISYYTTLVEDSRAVEKYNPAGFASRIDLRSEAIEYIAISFIDFGGPSKAKKYIEKIGNPEWGKDVLRKLGDIYMKEKEDYKNSIAAYKAFLAIASSSPEAPIVQKKIAECYTALNDEQEAFNVRQRLFMDYKAGGAWWNKIEDEKARLKAYRLAEQALRENINSVMKRAEELSSDSLYRKAVELGRTYLKSFPEDLYAYMIRWNIALILDTKLHLYKQALQEYLTISLVYAGDKYKKFAREKGLSSIKDAAENAIVVADSLVAIERRKLKKLSKVNIASLKGKKPVPLTTAEGWLAMTYDNYIKLFPFDKNTATVLANAGALYYTHNKFAEALKYFKTLVKYFPKSKQIQNVRYSILESYFGAQDYDSAEILAKKIIEGNAPKEIKEKAERRLGESIFFKAQALSEAGKPSLAGDEFYRMALEVPSLDFADRALFNAGREYEKAHSYDNAIRAYELLWVSYGGSSYLLDALNNLAFDYGEVKKYEKGAEVYETLSNLLKEKEKAKDALYNACIFYEKAENWQKAIETSTAYANHYPEAKDAPVIYFKVGTYYHRINNPESAVKIYSDFTERFPDSPLGVEAYFKIGKYYLDRDSLAEAEKAFYKAFSLSNVLKSKGLDENSYYASEGLYFATKLLHDRFKKISFTLPEENLNRAVAQKQTLLRQLVDQYTKIISYKTQRLPECVYRIGEAYEDFAQAWAHQEIPDVDPTTRAVKEKNISERTTKIYNHALSAYKKAVEVLERIGGQTISQPDSNVSSQSDTLVSITKDWLEKAREKVSETLYKMAEINTHSIDQLLSAPIPADLTDIARLEYQSQVLIKAIRPLVDIVVEAHIRNLKTADSLNIENKWTEASRAKIISSLSLLSKKYEDLSFEAVKEYKQAVSLYKKMTIDENQEPSESFVTNMANFLDLSKSFSQAVIAFTKNGVEKARESGIKPSKITSMEEDMVRFALQMADSLESLIASGTINQKKAEELFQKANDPMYEDILSVFEDNVFFLNENLKTILETAYNINNKFEIPAPSGEWLAVRLIKLYPAIYAKKFNILLEKLVVPADTTWWYSSLYQQAWRDSSFDMKGWLHPQAGIDSGFVLMDNTSFQKSGIGVKNSNFFYVRKEINIPGIPISAKAIFQVDPPDSIFINNKDLIPNFGAKMPILLTSFFHRGKNLFAGVWRKKDKVSVSGIITIKYISREALHRNEVKIE